MLAIRMQRTGRKGHAQFRVIVQDSRFHPSSGRVVAYLGSYNPHSKQSNFDKDKLDTYLKNGAQPSERVVKLLKAEKVKFPDWVSTPPKKKKAVRNPDKRRSTRPEGAPEPDAKAPTAEAEAVAEPEAPAETPADDQSSEASSKEEKPAEEAPAEPQAEGNKPAEPEEPTAVVKE